MFVDLQAAQALRAAGFDARDIHVLQSRDFVEAVAQSQSPLGFLTSMDYDVYLHEASRGRSFVAVRPAGYAQLKQSRDLLAPHHARLANSIDTWMVAELLPQRCCRQMEWFPTSFKKDVPSSQHNELNAHSSCVRRQRRNYHCITEERG